MLIIKKPRNLDIKKNIGRLFRGHNIIEYKSPSDSFNAFDYSKAFAYAYLYAFLAHISPDDTTITMVASNHPRSLLRRLRNDARLTVEDAGRGIHYIRGERMPVQIIEQKALSKTENLWLGSLRKDLSKTMLGRLVDESRQRNDVGAYIYAVLAANEKTLRGEIQMANFMKTLSEKPEFAEELVKLGYINVNDAVKPEFAEELVKLGYINVNDAKKQDSVKSTESAKRLLKNGVSVDIVANSLGLSLVRVDEIKAELDKEKLAQVPTYTQTSPER